MAHVHGAKTAKAVTEAASAGAAKMMESAMAGMGKMGEGMMHSGMADMGSMGGGMMQSGMAGMAGMGNMGGAMTHSAMGGAAAGAVATAGKSTFKKILTHPVTLLGIGFAIGYLVYKYRKDIISQSAEE